jgi:DNA repair protein RecO
MSKISDKGIVLKETKKGETDKILTVLFFTRGKLVVYARGACKLKSKIGTACRLLTLSEFSIFEKGGLLAVSQANVIDSFYSVVMDYERYIWACFIVEVLDKTTPADIPFEVDCNHQNIFRLAVYALKAIRTHRSPKLCAAVFASRFAAMEGYAPENITANETVSFAYKFSVTEPIEKIFSFLMEENNINLFFGKVIKFITAASGSEILSILAIDNINLKSER